MADDPLFGFTPVQQPAPGDDPLMGFKPVPSQVAALGADPLLAQQPNGGWGASILSHLHGASRTLDDLATFGFADKGQGALDQAIGSGPSTAQLRADTNAAYAANPAIVNAGLGAATYGMGPGELGIATRLGGGVLGSGAEGLTAGALAGAGKSDPQTWGGLGKDALTGGAIGGVTGLGLGAVGKYVLNPIVNAVANKVGSATGPLSQPADITATAKAAKDAAYGALDQPKYDQTELMNHLDDIKSDLYANDPDGTLPKSAPRSMKAFNDLYTQTATAPYKTQTASSILTAIQKLDSVQGHSAGAENDVAPFLQDRLSSIFDNLDPVTAHSPADVRQMLDSANDAQKTFANARDLQQWSQSLKGFGSSPAGPAQKVAETFYPDPSSPQYQALSKIALAGGGGMSPYGAMHAMAPVVDLATAGAGGLVGGPAGAVIGEHAGNLVNYGLLKPAAGAALGAMSKAATQRAINAAYPALTGQSVRFPAMNLSPALRAIIFGTAASSIK